MGSENYGDGWPNRLTAAEFQRLLRKRDFPNHDPFQQQYMGEPYSHPPGTTEYLSGQIDALLESNKRLQKALDNVTYELQRAKLREEYDQLTAAWHQSMAKGRLL